jgi:hypothetical protein
VSVSKGLRFLPQFADSTPGEYAEGHARTVHPHFFRAFEFSRRRLSPNNGTGA